MIETVACPVCCTCVPILPCRNRYLHLIPICLTTDRNGCSSTRENVDHPHTCVSWCFVSRTETQQRHDDVDHHIASPNMTQVKDKDEKTLTYAQFAAALNVVAATLFPKVRNKSNLIWKRFIPLRRMLRQVWRRTLCGAGKIDETPEERSLVADTNS